LVYTKGYFVYGIHKPLAIERILRQPGVRAIYDYRKPPFDREIDSQIMFVAPIPGYRMFVLGPHDPYREVLFVQTEQPPSVLRIPIDGRGGDQALFHDDEPGMFVMAGRSHLYRIGVDPPRIVDALDLSEKKLPLNMARYDAKNDRYIVTRAYHSHAYLVNRKTFQLARTLKAPPGSCYTDGWVDPKNNALILLGNYLVGGGVFAYDLNTLDLHGEVRLPWSPVTLGTVDVRGRRLYVATLLGKRILVFNLDGLERVGELDAEFGMRNLNFDSERRWLIGGNLFSGHLRVYDVDAGRLIGKLFLGKLVRWVEVNRKNGLWYSNSSAGGFEIDPELALTGPRDKEFEG